MFSHLQLWLRSRCCSHCDRTRLMAFLLLRVSHNDECPITFPLVWSAHWLTWPSRLWRFQGIAARTDALQKKKNCLWTHVTSSVLELDHLIRRLRWCIHVGTHHLGFEIRNGFDETGISKLREFLCFATMGNPHRDGNCHDLPCHHVSPTARLRYHEESPSSRESKCFNDCSWPYVKANIELLCSFIAGVFWCGHACHDHHALCLDFVLLPPNEDAESDGISLRSCNRSRFCHALLTASRHHACQMLRRESLWSEVSWSHFSKGSDDWSKQNSLSAFTNMSPANFVDFK